MALQPALGKILRASDRYGTNRVPLIKAQRTYQDFGACEEHGRKLVHIQTEEESPHPAWRSSTLRDLQGQGRRRTTPVALRLRSAPLAAPTFWHRAHVHLDAATAANPFIWFRF